MKKIFITIALVILVCGFGFAQKNVDKIVEVKGGKAEIKFDFADNIKIETWKNDFVEVHVTVDIDNNTYNDFYALNVNEKGGKVQIEEKVDFDGIKKKRGNDRWNNFNTELNYTLKVPESLDFDLNTISGKIELIGCLGEMKINSVSGFIDYSVPASHKTKIDLSTVTGDVYSNLKFDNKIPDEISWVGTSRKLSVNGGNIPVELKTVSGDIYLRKL